MTEVDARIVLSLGWFSATIFVTIFVLGLPIALHSLKYPESWTRGIGFRLLSAQVLIFLVGLITVITYIHCRHITHFEIPSHMEISQSLDSPSGIR